MSSNTVFGTLVAGVVSEVAFTNAAFSRVEVLLRGDVEGDDLSPMFVTVGDGGAGQGVPVVDGVGSDYVPAGLASKFRCPSGITDVMIRLISEGTPRFAVRVW